MSIDFTKFTKPAQTQQTAPLPTPQATSNLMAGLGQAKERRNSKRFVDGTYVLKVTNTQQIMSRKDGKNRPMFVAELEIMQILAGGVGLAVTETLGFFQYLDVSPEMYQPRIKNFLMSALAPTTAEEVAQLEANLESIYAQATTNNVLAGNVVKASAQSKPSSKDATKVYCDPSFYPYAAQ